MKHDTSDLANFDRLPEYHTIGQIVDLIEEMKGRPGLAEYAQTLAVPRQRGSSTRYNLQVIPPDTPLVNVTGDDEAKHVAQGCDCYRIHAPYLCGEMKVLPLDLALRAGMSVRMREGDHGEELVSDRELPSIPSEYVYIIVGLEKGLPAVFTWHPGPPLGRLEDGVDRFTAVKSPD